MLNFKDECSTRLGQTSSYLYWGRTALFISIYAVFCAFFKKLLQWIIHAPCLILTNWGTRKALLRYFIYFLFRKAILTAIWPLIMDSLKLVQFTCFFRTISWVLQLQHERQNKFSGFSYQQFLILIVILGSKVQLLKNWSEFLSIYFNVRLTS